jgi:cytochrome c peroxidase
LKTAATITFILLVVSTLVAVESCKKTTRFSGGKAITFKVPEGWPAPEYDFENNPLTEEGFALGRKLFYDGRLSKDGGFPCSSCHQQVAAFGTFDHDRSHGYNNSHTLRNAPPLQNLAWKKFYRWDGSSTSVEQVTVDHITSAVEMGETIENVVNKLRADSTYPSMFKAAFGDENIGADRMTKALSQFLLLLVSSNSKFDKVKRGEASFDVPERLGYDLFKAKCAACHTEAMFTDYGFRNTGATVDPLTQDYGRLRVTKRGADSLKFAVPSLRNVEKTFPYGHDGRWFGYDDVLEHYRSRVVNGPTTHPLVKNGIPMSNFEFGQIKAFLNTLTDTAFINNKRFSDQ